MESYRYSRTRSFVVVVIGTVVGVSALALVMQPAGRPSSDGLADFWAPTPASLEELVTGGQRGPHAIIAVAVVEGVRDYGREPTPTRDPADPPEDLWLWLAPPYTRYTLAVERPLLDDGTIQSGQPLVIYRGLAYPGYPPWNPEYPAEEPGERYLYFLAREGDDYFSPRGAYSRLIVDGEQVTYSDPQRSPVLFAEGTPPAEFIDAVATAVATLYPTPTP